MDLGIGELKGQKEGEKTPQPRLKVWMIKSLSRKGFQTLYTIIIRGYASASTLVSYSTEALQPDHAATNLTSIVWRQNLTNVCGCNFSHREHRGYSNKKLLVNQHVFQGMKANSMKRGVKSPGLHFPRLFYGRILGGAKKFINTDVQATIGFMERLLRHRQPCKLAQS